MKKQIIMDYKEYCDLLDLIKKEEDLLKELYSKATAEQKEKIEDVLTYINSCC